MTENKMKWIAIGLVVGQVAIFYLLRDFFPFLGLKPPPKKEKDE